MGEWADGSGGHIPLLPASPWGSHLHGLSSDLPSPLNRKCSQGALYTGFSVLVALLLAGQATTAYFLYQQQGRLDKLTVTSQNLQLENLRMKLPKCAFSISILTPLLSLTSEIPFLPLAGPIVLALGSGIPAPFHLGLRSWSLVLEPFSLGTGTTLMLYLLTLQLPNL